MMPKAEQAQQQAMLTKEEAEALKTKLEAERNYFPKEPFKPLRFPKLPHEYEIVCTSKEQFEAMDKYGKGLRKKHPSWKEEKVIRKVFEQFPSVKIKLKTNDESTVSGSSQENTSGDHREDSI